MVLRTRIFRVASEIISESEKPIPPGGNEISQGLLSEIPCRIFTRSHTFVLNHGNREPHLNQQAEKAKKGTGADPDSL